jgi:ketosteroid isomerase-like protein
MTDFAEEERRPARPDGLDTAAVVNRYYELANAGNWDAWCDLFAPDQVMDEQLAGRIEGAQSLRELMKGFPDTYRTFQNTPVHMVVDGEQAAVVSHISAVTTTARSIEAEVCNYLVVRQGRIRYLANFHDSVPFQPVRPG